MQKYKIIMDGAVIVSGYFASVDYELLEHQTNFIRSRVKEGVIVELVTWIPSR